MLPLSNTDYFSVRRHAQTEANRTGFDYGIEKLGNAYRTWRLPKPSHRFGFEMRCEVVRPEQLLEMEN